jgi:hypothetical protein
MKNACKGVFHLFVLGFIFGFLGLGFWVGAEKRGATTTPPLSAECQIQRKSRTKPGGARVCGGEFSATFRRVFRRHFKFVHYMLH